MTAHSHDKTQPARFFTRWLSSIIRGYQLFISPLFGPHCRYYPSCSEYARQAFIVYGPIKGGRLAIGRLLRCNPFSYGGVDLLPERDCCNPTDAPTHSSPTREFKPNS